MGENSDLTLPCLVHDLNNVFQTLMEAADLLSSDPRWEPLSAAILRSIERGKNITQSIQSVEQTASPLDLILANAISFMHDSLVSSRGPKILFSTQVDPGIELLRTWAWERVFINLFTNAVRAMPHGGVIHVTGRRIGPRVEITVRDEGAGIAPEIMHDLFKPNVSTHGSRGLGLHIVETIVKQESGYVHAENRRDRQGAQFTISIPAEPAAVAAAYA
jgi:signal transduction histidine kinase